MLKNNIINLNVHSYYSLLSSTLSIDKIINFAISNNQEYVCLIDKNVMYGAIEFYKKSIANNLKPVIGVQFDFSDSSFVAIAKNNDGYQFLLKLSSKIMQNQLINFDELNNTNIFLIRVNGEYNCDFPNFYINDGDSYNSIACHEVFYYDENDYIIYNVLNAIKNDEKLTKYNINETNNKNCFWMSNQIQNTYSTNAIQNLQKILMQIDWKMELPRKPNILKFTNNFNLTSKEYLYQLCYSNLDKYINSHNLEFQRNVYFDRLEYELDIIDSKGFNDYFLIVFDFINWSKNNDIIIGPGRGSAAGSLVSFCLNITEIDPIKYNLLFERFLNYERTSMPDIDTDIMDIKRDEVVNYLYNKYGNDHVCNIVTFSHIKAKQAIRDVARVFEIDLKIVDKISKNISSNYDEDILTMVENNKILHEEYLQNNYLFEIANRIINIPRQISVHAAGIVLSNSKLTDIVPLQTTSDNKVVTQYSMEYLEELGLIKMDLLGLKNLTVIYYVLKLIEHIHKIKINLLDIDLNDQNIFEMFTNAQTDGIFQFESPGMKRILKRMKPTSVEDLSLVSAMFRPGALGNIDLFFSRKLKNEQPEYVNQDIANILSPTYGAFIYQEQIIEVVKTMAMFSGSKSDNFRRAISKKKEDVINDLKNDFINGSIQNHYTMQQANEMFEYIKEFGNYGFNHSHSISYAMLSYWIAYLKYHYPIETISILMTYGDNSKEKLIGYVYEARKFNIQVRGPSINDSTLSFIIYKNDIIFSLISINGLGIESAKKIISIRENMPNKKFPNALVAIAILSNSGISKRNIENLIKVGAFDNLLLKRNFLLKNVDKLCDKKLNIIDDNYNFIFDLNLDNNIKENYDDYSIYEKEILGISFYKSKYENIWDENQKKYNLISLENLKNIKQFNALVQIKHVYQNISKNDRNFLKIIALDNEKEYELYCFENINSIYNDLVGCKYAIIDIKKNKEILVVNSVLQKIGD